jgi:hypothetical protein
MKGDFSRRTFDATRHFTGVHMQQGRVLLDADWNEQADLTRHRTEVETRDLVGGCGGPLHQAAFGVLPYAGLPPEIADAIDARYPAARGASAGDVVLTAGRYYVHGILCENEAPVPFAWQPDLPPQDGPGKGAAILNPGFHLLYLDVWERHLTALDVRSLRETALGGPDTATRTRTVWQVRSVFLRSRENAGDTGPLCESSSTYEAATAQPTGTLRARARPEEAAANPCVLPPGAGYHGLENQLYRVEIHQGGAALDLSGGGVAGVEVTGAEPDDRRVTVAGGAWAVGDAVELFFSAPDRDPMAGTVAFVEEVENGGGGAKVLTLNATFTAVNVAADQPRLRPVETTWKWSRDNGTVVAAILSIKDREVTIEHPGGDDVLGFRPGDWVEITDDYHDLHGIPGELVQVERRSTSLRTIVLRTAPAVLAANPDGVDPTRTPRLRRWDGIGAVKRGAPGEGYAALEDGVEVRFSAGTYQTGGFWMIPARTATGAEGGTIEWPHAPAGGGPLAQAPRGIRHHYCRLAIVERTGDTVVPVRDCRCLFAPVTAINAIAYVSGAGQEGMPDLTDPTVKVPLGLPLVVGMANGHCREGERVRFTVVDGDGDLAVAEGAFGGDDVVDVEVGADGLARCWWQLDGTTQHQRVRARLLDGDLEVHAPVLFNASLSVAHEVAYDPRTCGTLQEQKTVQDAIDRVVDLVRIHRAGGDGQEAMPGETLPAELRVLVTSTCGPVANLAAAVEFEVIGGGGTLAGGGQTFTADTDGDGFATVSWTLDGATDYQEVEARLTDAVELPAEQKAVRFGATLSVARNVSYDTGDCGPLQDSGTVQAALDRLAALVRMHPAGPVVQTLTHGASPAALRVLVASTCGPVAQRRVQFAVLSGGGTLSGGGGGSGSGTTVTRVTSAQGVASVNLSAPAGTLVHEVEARFEDDAPDEVEPRRVRFVVVRGQAGDVAYTPGNACADLAAAGVETVSQALDVLCARPIGGSGGCSVTVGEGGDFSTLGAALAVFQTGTAMSICLLPGEHPVTEDVGAMGGGGSIRITGSGRRTMLRVNEGSVTFGGLDSVILRDLALHAEETPTPLTFRECADVTVDNCDLAQTDASSPLVRVLSGTSVRFVGCEITAYSVNWMSDPLLGGLTEGVKMPQFARLANVEALAATVVDRLASSQELRFGLAEALQMILQGDSPAGAPALPRAEEALLDLQSADSLLSRRATIGGAFELTAARELLRVVAQRILYAEVLTLVDAAADVAIVDCRLGGYLRLYGDTEPLSRHEYEAVASQVAEGGVSERSRASLDIRGTTLVATALDRSAFTEDFQPRNDLLIYRHAGLVSNIVVHAHSGILAASVKAAENEFPGLDARGLTSFSNTATIVGNAAPARRGQVFVFTRPNQFGSTREAAANVLSVFL